MLPTDVNIASEALGMPSPEALQLATEVIRRRYILPETMRHPAVRSECLRLAYLIMAYGLAPPEPEGHARARAAQRQGEMRRPATPREPRGGPPRGRDRDTEAVRGRERVDGCLMPA